MRNHVRSCAKFVVIVPLIWACGCSSTALRHDYSGYSEVYADASNQQLLLNLARLANNDPVYYVQLGSISSQYQFSSSAGFTPSAVRTDPVAVGAGMVQHALTLGGSLNAGVTATPVFQYLPLTGTNFVQAVLAPLSDKVYLTLYDQGYDADMIVRTMIASVEWQHITTNGGPTLILTTNTAFVPAMITNSATMQVSLGIATNLTCTTNVIVPTSTNYTFLVNDPSDPTYPDFLKFSADLRHAQLWHILTVDQSGGDPTTNVIYNNQKQPKLADVVSAIQATLSVKSDSSNNVIVSQLKQSPHFVLRNSLTTHNYNIMSKLDPQTNIKPQTNTDGAVYDTRPETEKISAAIEVAKDIYGNKMILKTRTFEAAMYSVAKQQTRFHDLAETDKDHNLPHIITYGEDDYGPYAIIKLPHGNIKARPTMTLNYDKCKLSPDHILTKVKYLDGKTYVVGDISKSKSYQNQGVFTMLCYLFAQTAVSTQNLPVQQLIQVQ